MPDSPATSGSSAPPATVLIVDDEVEIGSALKLALARRIRGLRILTATTPREGLEILAREPVDVILSDYKMPGGMTGLEFLAKSRETAPGVVRVMMTAFPDESLAIRAINELRLEHFFTKPFSLEKAVEVVTRILDDRRADAARQRAFARTLDLARRASADAG